MPPYPLRKKVLFRKALSHSYVCLLTVGAVSYCFDACLCTPDNRLKETSPLYIQCCSYYTLYVLFLVRYTLSAVDVLLWRETFLYPSRLLLLLACLKIPFLQ